MAPEQFVPRRPGLPYNPPSAARALEAARTELPQTLPRVTPRARFETTLGSRYVVRTMRGDIEAALQRDKTSLGTVVLAEERRRLKRGVGGEGSELSRLEPLEAPRRLSTAALAMVGGTILLVGAIIAVVLVLRPTVVPMRPVVPVRNAVVPVDGAISPVTLSGLTTLAIQTHLREAVFKAHTPINTVFAIPLVDRGQLLPEEKGTILVEVTTDELFRRLAPDVPGALRRALDPAFTFGVHAFKGDSAFFAFGIQSFDIVFAEMLHWERTLSFDLGPIFRQNRAIPSSTKSVFPSVSTDGGGSGVLGIPSGNATSSGDEPVPRRTLRSGTGRFEDGVVKNYDVRILRDEGGEPLILYAFPNRSTLLIAGSTVTLEELISRLATTPGRE